MQQFTRQTTTLCLLLCLCACGLGTAPNPTAEPGVSLDDFEAATTPWRAADPDTYRDSSALTVRLTSTGAPQGAQALVLAFDKTDRPKATFVLEQPLDLSAGRYLSLTLVNPEPAAASAVALAVSTGGSWTWHETPAVALAAGRQRLTFDLAAEAFATAATNWAPTAALAERSATQRLAVLLYPVRAGEVVLDDVRLSETGTATAFMPAPTATPAPRPQPPTTLTLAPPAAPAAVNHGAEFTLLTDGVFANPFDPAQADLWVTFTAPSGRVSRAPAFWYQAYDPATLAPVGAPGWRARFTPTEPGRWTAQAAFAAPAVASGAVAFEVAPSNAPGFVRLDARNPRYFAFESGAPFFPIGLNLAWSTGDVRGDYDRWFTALSANGGNAARVWMASWSFGLEWSDTGLGDYTGRLKQAWLLDEVFTLAEARGIYLMLTLLNHGAFSEQVNPEWAANPYNAALGGPLAHPGDFVTDPAAQALFERRLRYIAARWGYATHLWAWEWWNEVNWTPIPDATLGPWVQTMSTALQRYDPNDHLMTLSYANGVSTKLWSLPELDFVQQHDYSGRDLAAHFADQHTRLARLAPDKPVVMGELGATTTGDEAPYSRDGVHHHNGLWAAPFTGFAASGMYWWWDNYIDPLSLWSQYKGLAVFLKDEDLAALAAAPVTPSAETVVALARQGPRRALVWVRHADYSLPAATLAYYKASGGTATPTAWTYTLAPLTGLTLALNGLEPGAYEARWFDPQTAEWLAPSEPVTVTAEGVTLAIPPLRRDLALKVTPVQSP